MLNWTTQIVPRQKVGGNLLHCGYFARKARSDLCERFPPYGDVRQEAVYHRRLVVTTDSRAVAEYINAELGRL